MKKWDVEIAVNACVTVEVEANTKEQAIEAAKDIIEEDLLEYISTSDMNMSFINEIDNDGDDGDECD